MNDVSHEQGRTFLYVSHNMNTIRQFCDRVVVLDHGRIAFDGNVEEGINVYLRNTGRNTLQVHYNFTDVKRNYSYGTNIFPKSFDILGTDKAVLKKSALISCSLRFISNIQQDNMQVIARIKNIDQTIKFGGCLTTPFSVSLNKEYQVEFDLDTQLLAPDIYCLTYEIVQYNQSGDYFAFDNPMVAMPIQIVKTEDEVNNWTIKYWGNMILPEMSIKSVKQHNI